jgi:amidase
VLGLCRSTFPAFDGCVIEEDFPRFDMDRLWQAFMVWRGWNAAGYRDLLSLGVKPELAWEIEQGLRLSLSDVDAAVQTRADWYQTVAEFFNRYDFVLAPSAQVFPFDASLHWPAEIDGQPMDTYHRWMETVMPWTMAGVPVLGMPAGFDDRGLPMGVQLVGSPRDDRGVLQLGRVYEARTGWVSSRPPALLGD